MGFGTKDYYYWLNYCPALSYLGYRQKVKDIVHGALFPEAGLESGGGHGGGAGGMVVVRDIDLFSYCESCLIPFQVKCHVGYVPSGHRVVGLSKFSRVTDIFAKRLQDPQRLADEVCKALQHAIRAAGVAVVLQCSHIHLPNFESKKKLDDDKHPGWTKILVSSRSGVFEEEEGTSDWTEFLSHLRFRGIKMADAFANDSLHWCPMQSSLKIGPTNSAMTQAVISILRSLGEDPLRAELIRTPSHFVSWLMKFKCSNLEIGLNGFARTRKDIILQANGNNSHDDDGEDLSTELNLSLWSQCEHHLLPFHGVVHVGYYHSGAINPIDRSFLQQIVHFYGFKLQVQERLTRQIAETVSLHLGEDVMVVAEASHTCMISRGIEKFGSNTATVAVLGKFASDSTARVKFLQSIPNSYLATE